MSPPTPSEVSQLWSFQRADSVLAPLGGHAPIASASVSTEGGEEETQPVPPSHASLMQRDVKCGAQARRGQDVKKRDAGES